MTENNDKIKKILRTQKNESSKKTSSTSVEKSIIDKIRK